MVTQSHARSTRTAKGKLRDIYPACSPLVCLIPALKQKFLSQPTRQPPLTEIVVPVSVYIPLTEAETFWDEVWLEYPYRGSRFLGAPFRVASRTFAVSVFYLRASAVVLSFASRILHSSHFLGRQIEAATKQAIEMALVGEASHLSNFGNG